MLVHPKLYKDKFSPTKKNPKFIGKLLVKNPPNPEQSESTLTKQIGNIGINTSRLTNWLQKTDFQKTASKFSFNSSIYQINIGGIDRSKSENKSYDNEKEEKKLNKSEVESESYLPPLNKIKRSQERYNELIENLNEKKKSYPTINDKQVKKNLNKSAIFYEKRSTEEEPQFMNPKLAIQAQKQPIYCDEVFEEPESFVEKESTIQKPKEQIIINLQTPVSQIKKFLIQGDSQIFMTFIIPEVFLSKLSPSASSSDLHRFMTQAFKSIDKTPKIVSIKKFINCVVMRDTRFCIIWNFNGKVYFGGWNRNSVMVEGNKHGLGLEWIPQKYIYYGEFHNNKKEGYGIMKKVSGEIYIGCWANNLRSGWGKVYNRDGNLIMDGQFEEGCLIAQRQK